MGILQATKRACHPEIETFKVEKPKCLQGMRLNENKRKFSFKKCGESDTFSEAP